MTKRKFLKSKTSKRIFYLFLLSLVCLFPLAVVVFFVMGYSFSRTSRPNDAMTIRNAQQAMRGQCNLFGIESTDEAKSYREHYLEQTGEDAPYELHEEIFGPDGYVITEKRGQLPEHSVNGARFDYTLGDPDLLTPLGTMYITSKGVPDPDSYRPQDVE